MKLKKYFIPLFFVILIFSINIVFAENNEINYQTLHNPRTELPIEISPTELQNYNNDDFQINYNKETINENHITYFEQTPPNKTTYFDQNSKNLPFATLTGSNVEMYYKNGAYSVNLKSVTQQPLPNQHIIFNVNGVNYLKTTDSQGNAKLNINLRPGNYLIKASYNGNLYNVPEITNTIVVLPTIESKNIVKKYKNNTQFYAYILNNNGLNLANTPYTFNINGIIHSGTSNNEGVIKININLSPGNYIATVTNPLDNLDIGYTIQVIKDDVQLIAENYVNNKKGEYYQAKLLDSSNKPIIGQNIKIIANGVTYVKTTDSKGIAKLKINYDPGIKQVYCEFIGDNYYNPYITPNKTITILNSNTKLNVSIIHENKLFNTTQCIFSIKLQDNNGYDMANKNLLFNINNLTYNLLTNNDGIAQICLNLTEGNYLTMTLFNTSNYYNIAQIFTYITVNLTNNFNNSTIVYENIEYNENKTDMIEYELRIFNDENDIEEINSNNQSIFHNILNSAKNNHYGQNLTKIISTKTIIGVKKVKRIPYKQYRLIQHWKLQYRWVYRTWVMYKWSQYKSWAYLYHHTEYRYSAWRTI